MECNSIIFLKTAGKNADSLANRSVCMFLESTQRCNARWGARLDTGPLDALLAPGNPCAASALDIAPSKHPDFIFVGGVSQISQKKKGQKRS